MITKKILTMMTALAALIGLSSCEDNHPYDDPWNYNYNNQGNGFNNSNLSQQLSTLESAMVGSWVSNDGGTAIYITFSQDRTGTMGNAPFQWYVQDNNLYVNYTDAQGGQEYYTVSYANETLTLNNIPFIRYNQQQGGDTQQDALIRQWQGKQDVAYYQDVLGISATDNWTTAYEFASNGEGTQLDYDKTAPQTSFAYTPFTWVKNGNTISLSYVSNDIGLTSASIDNYALSATEFSGQASYSGYGTYTFVYTATSGINWSVYAQSTAKATRAATTTNRLQTLRQLSRTAFHTGI